MTDTDAPNDNLEKRMKEIPSGEADNSGRTTGQGSGASRGAQSDQGYAARSPSAPPKKGMGFGKKTALGGGLLLGGLVGGTLYVTKKVVDFVYPPKPKKLAQAGLSLGIVYFMLNPISCSRQIGKSVTDYVINPSKKIVYGQDKIKELQKERDAAQQRIKELTTARKPAPSLDKRVDQGYVPQAAQAQPQVVKSFSSYANPRLGSLTKPASVQSLESIFRQKGTSYDHLVYIDKSSQTLTLFDIRDGSISAVKKYACTTGMNDGPRQSEGDKRTPEGVYNIDRCFGSTGNPLLGDRFMGIDYPNQYDVSAGRSGKGIGISGTGLIDREYAIDSGIRLSNGGVVMKNRDVNELYHHIAGSSLSNTLVLIEDQRRPIRFER